MEQMGLSSIRPEIQSPGHTPSEVWEDMSFTKGIGDVFVRRIQASRLWSLFPTDVNKFKESSDYEDNEILNTVSNAIYALERDKESLIMINHQFKAKCANQRAITFFYMFVLSLKLPQELTADSGFYRCECASLLLSSKTQPIRILKITPRL